jgi:hypothetical protein
MFNARRCKRHWVQLQHTLIGLKKYLGQSIEEDPLQDILSALCIDWALTANYLPTLLHYIKIEQWEDYSGPAITAASALGHYLHQSNDAVIYQALLDEYQRGIELHEQFGMMFCKDHQKLIYESLEYGIRGQEALRQPLRFRFPDGVDESILDQAQKAKRKK